MIPIPMLMRNLGPKVNAWQGRLRHLRIEVGFNCRSTVSERSILVSPRGHDVTVREKKTTSDHIVEKKKCSYDFLIVWYGGSLFLSRVSLLGSRKLRSWGVYRLCLTPCVKSGSSKTAENVV